MTGEWCVVFNPVAGRRRAKNRLRRWRRELAGRADFCPTERPGHACELAREAALNGYSVVAAAGGDGTVHEVLNGLMQANRPDVRLGLLPIGSANDFAYSVAAGMGDGPPIRTIDVARIQSRGGERQAWFGCAAGLGFNAFVTLESRRIRALQGIALYGLATLRALARHFRRPRMEITLDSEPNWKTPTLMMSVLNGRREGSFPLAPRADIADGQLNFLHAGEVSRWQVLRLLPRLAVSGPPPEFPNVRQGKCRRVKIRSEEPLIVHVDGEFFCQPEDEIDEIVIEVCPRAIQVDLSLARPSALK